MSSLDFAPKKSGRREAKVDTVQRGGEVRKPATYQHGFRAAPNAVGHDDVSLHELRHGCTSTMVLASAPRIVVTGALHHADTRMVDKHYAHLAPSYVADVIRSTGPDLSTDSG